MFAVELNEVTSVERSHIPPTDARLRPDQKALEEGRVEEAENIKLEVEEAQRNRRRQWEEARRNRRRQWFGRHKMSMNSS